MGTLNVEPSSYCHVVALPYPGRGHINPIMNLCKQLVSRKDDILITFVVTEEWLGLIGSEPKPDNIRFGTIPNVIPSERDRAKDFPGFVRAVSTLMEAPFEEFLDRLELPVSAIVADTNLVWAVGVGYRRNIPVASLWPKSGSVYTVIHHFDHLVKNGHFPVNLSERGHEIVDYIPGMSTIRLGDIQGGLLTSELHRNFQRGAVSSVSKAQFLLCSSVYELEPQVFDDLKAKYPFPIYPVGPTIPYFLLDQTRSSSETKTTVPDYFKWLDSQPERSVLYISFGSFLSVSGAQLDEFVAGVRGSGTRYLWVARGDDATKVKEGCGDKGFVVPWCDQLRVLCHPSIGGFWTHCGWSSTLEAIFSGVPMLTYPILSDQMPNSKQIVDDWKIGYRVKKMGCDQSLVTRDEISELVKRFMDIESSEGKLMRERVKELKEAIRQATTKGGSTCSNLDAFIEEISSDAHQIKGVF
ncbi:UDP-glucuronosyl/UDP-glucosyltransferase [Trema orientale]|uniref:UDP-glucuronosyl/UDP-glucosyltransferase n=1 Tax=Trema orientale TaxID=63057 RepID=A0A2P5EJX7_TREOI|nr:UDP-glucuronosyl/UDP-glucosyltransferase [Trema orientale]